MLQPLSTGKRRALRFSDRLRRALDGRYAISGELGRGGMAVVYSAHDIRHDRPVALKVLRDDVGRTLGAERFLDEIRLVARLSHPHILPLFDSGEADGFLYFVMPVVAGASVRERLDAERTMPVEEAVRLAAEVAYALDYAHRQGIVHRDIKPENILLHEGHAFVADFGIGKVLTTFEEQAHELGGMSVGTSVGTPAYMSPEQAAGENVDGRSDLYSLGCVLYEMLVGEQPFTGPNLQAVVAKRFVQTPADVRSLRDGVPRGVAQALARALSRTPIERFESGAELAAALRAPEPAPIPTTAPPRSVAVLPFVNLSGDPENDYFADGITEEILNALAGTPSLRVAGRASSFAFKGSHPGLRAIGERLNVRTVLEGSVRRSGNRVRITAQLNDAADGCHLWSERYDREIGDVFALQDEIALAIASRLEATLHAGRRATQAQRATGVIAAYEAYLKGRSQFYRRGTGISEGLASMKLALELDPRYALAWAGRADGFSLLGYYGILPPEAWAPAAREAAGRALELGPNLAETHNALAQVALLHDWDWQATERGFQRALELNPGYLQASAWYGLIYQGLVCGRWSEATATLIEASRREPLSAYAAACLAFCLGYGGRLEEGVRMAERACELDPSSFLSQWALQNMLYVAGQHARSVEVGERLLPVSGRHPWVLFNLVVALADSGDLAAARAVSDEMNARGQREYVSPFHRGVCALFVGDVETGSALVREAIRRRDPTIPLFVRWSSARPAVRHLDVVAEVLAATRLPIAFGAFS
jgi:serine/threonine protein kinase/tetratricopeptide (TPR) repeat protein